MPSDKPSLALSSGGIHVGDVGGSVSFRALGDIVGGDKIVNITTTILISVEAVTQRPLVTASPYRGLDRFEDRDRDLFFGRDQLIKGLLAQLSTSNVLLVLGASGSGKSSVVRAGLLPALARILGAKFRSFTLVPDVNPFESLRGSLHGAGFGQSQTREVADAQSGTPCKLIHALQREGEQWLIFIDQFEEIFTRSEEPIRKNFIAALLAIAQDTTSSTKLVLAMRADFFDRFGPLPEFAKLIEKNITLVTDMHVDELRLAIEQPAAQHGVVYEQGLVEEIIKDVQGQAGSLPLLQYTLNLLWEEELRPDGLADRHLNTSAYRELGGVRGALQKRADEIYAAFGDNADLKRASAKQEIVRQIFLRLVDIVGIGSDDAMWRPVRRRVAMTIFSTAQEQEILQALINQKLLVSNREGAEATVEVAHEALFTSWEQLKKWIEGGKQVIFARNRFADDALRWHRRQQEDAAGADEELIGGARLGQALEMRARGDFITILGGLSETETKFLDASAAVRDRRIQENLDRQKRELAQAQDLATEQKKRADDQAKAVARQRRLTIGISVLFVVAVVAAAFFLVQKGAAKRAESDALIAKSNALVASQQAITNEQIANRRGIEMSWQAASQARGNANSYTTDDPIIAAHYLLSAADLANRTGDKSIAKDADLAAQLQTEHLLFSFVHDSAVAEAKFSPDGHFIWTLTLDGLLSGDTGEGQLWSATNGKPVGLPMKHNQPIRGCLFSTDGNQILTWSGATFGSLLSIGVGSFDGGEARLWNVSDGKPIGEAMKHEDAVTGASFSGDGQHILTWSEDGTARLWNSADGKPFGELMKHQKGVEGALFSGDGRRILTWSKDGTAKLWNANDGKPVGEAMKHEDAVTGASFSGDGQHILTWSEDGTARLWNSADGKPFGELMKHQKGVEGALFSGDGRRILTWSKDGTAKLWNANDGKPVGKSLQSEKVRFALFSPDDETVLTVSHGAANLWDAIDGSAKGEPIRHSEINGARFSSSGFELLTWGMDGTARLWSPKTGKSQGKPMGLGQPIVGASFSSDNQKALTWDLQGNARLWETDDCTACAQPMTHSQGIRGAIFSPDEATILTWSLDGLARLWRTDTYKEQRKRELFSGNGVHGIIFSGDDQHILTWSKDGTARLWNSADGKPFGEVMKHNKAVKGASFSGDGQHILTWSEDGIARLWNSADGKPFGEAMKHDKGVEGAMFSGNGRRILTWSGDSARLWDANDGKPIGDMTTHEGAVSGASFSGDSRWILTWSGDTVWLWDASDGKLIGKPMKLESLVISASFNPLDQSVMTLSVGKWDTGIITQWNFARSTPIDEPMKLKNYFGGSLFSPNGELILTWTDSDVQLWRARDGKPVGESMKHEDVVQGAIFTKNGQHILTWAGTDIRSGETRMWITSNQKCIAVLKSKQSIVSATLNHKESAILTVGILGETQKWDISYNDRSSLAQRILDFEVRSGTTYNSGKITGLNSKDWKAKISQLADSHEPPDAK